MAVAALRLMARFLQAVSKKQEHVTEEYFNGAHLEDAQEKIVGMEENTRHMKLKSLQEIDTDYFVDLLQQSIELSQAGHSPPFR